MFKHGIEGRQRIYAILESRRSRRSRSYREVNSDLTMEDFSNDFELSNNDGIRLACEAVIFITGLQHRLQ